MDIEILLFDGFDELDAIGPWEVFSGLARATGGVTARLVTLEGARAVPADHGAVVAAHGAPSERPDLLLSLAAAGVLDGHRATTNPLALDDLRARGTVDVVPARVVDDGTVVTAGAPACGLDLAVHLVRRFVGPDVADGVARALQHVVPERAVTA